MQGIRRGRGRPHSALCLDLLDPAASLYYSRVTGQPEFRIGVLGSGKGSNFVAIADACAGGTIPARVAIVLSDMADAPILERARERSIPAHFVSPGQFRTKLDEQAEQKFVQALRDARADLVALAGF